MKLYNVKPYYIEMLSTPEEFDFRIQFPTETFDPSLITKDTSYDIDDNRSVIICDKETLKDVKRFFKSTDLKFIIKEASDMLFMDEIDLSKATDGFKENLLNYIVSNYDTNDVLDKILEKGIESLTKIDKKILGE